VERLTSIEKVHAVRLTPAVPVYPGAMEPAALYLAMAYTDGSKVIAAPDKILDRLRELGWSTK
jgi:hypothetical protein